MDGMPDGIPDGIPQRLACGVLEDDYVGRG